MLADVNGDSYDDVVGFGPWDVWVSLGTGSGGFWSPTSWSSEFTGSGGWRSSRHPRMLADVNGDQKADIIGFFDTTVVVALSSGTGFGAGQTWHNDFTFARGWDPIREPRFVADVNGDRQADIVAFGGREVLVALSTGTQFGPLQTWGNELVGSPASGATPFGWNSIHTPRAVGDVNGDGMADIIGFGSSGDVRVGLSNGSRFQATATWINNFGFAQGWSGELHPRIVKDFDGDGRADIVGFGERVWVSSSTGSGFSAPVEVLNQFVHNKGWTVRNNPRAVARLNGGQADIVGFGDRGVHVFLR
ncbi:MAG: VCBS repeat-containing protein [Archangium sp.]|nr:VCBS repeat-containing protein [Archangium sp.]